MPATAEPGKSATLEARDADGRVSLTRRLIVGSNPRRTLVRVLVLTAISFITFRWVLIPIRAEGISMLPTYRSGSLNFVNRLAFTFRPPARGEVVAIRLAGPHVVFVKRIIGL
ncbi:MAG: S26 family signal peptidase, partial [Acidobacteriota bacterium]